MSKWYGSISNRIEEGHNYNKDNQIHVGDDITMYHWSDRTCYYVTDVIDQKHIKVSRYHTCADQDKEGGMGHQNWMYFKTLKEMDTYLRKYFPKDDPIDPTIIDKPEPKSLWVYRYNHWNEAIIYDKDTYKEMEQRFNITDENREDYYKHGCGFTNSDYKKYLAGETVYKYKPLANNISFGVRDYYYDWEF